MTLTPYRRRATASIPSSPDEIVWGVRRKIGYSEIDDPSVHSGLTQHAFSLSDYGIALCGTKTYGQRRPEYIRLAVPTQENPVCRECSTAIAFEVSEVGQLDRIRELTAPAARDTVAMMVASNRRVHEAAEPVSIDGKRRVAVSVQPDRAAHHWPVKDFSRAA